jgi:hypothetical protein
VISRLGKAGIRLGTGQPSVALANRPVPIDPVNARLVRSIG